MPVVSSANVLCAILCRDEPQRLSLVHRSFRQLVCDTQFAALGLVLLAELSKTISLVEASALGNPLAMRDAVVDRLDIGDSGETLIRSGDHRLQARPREHDTTSARPGTEPQCTRLDQPPDFAPEPLRMHGHTDSYSTTKTVDQQFYYGTDWSIRTRNTNPIDDLFQSLD